MQCKKCKSKNITSGYEGQGLGNRAHCLACGEAWEVETVPGEKNVIPASVSENKKDK